MIRARPEGSAFGNSCLQNLGPVDRHGIHEVEGPLLVGGVHFLNKRTGLFDDLELRHILTDDQRFQAYLEFREQAFEIAVTQLISGITSPADLFLLIAEDRDYFNSGLVEHILMRSSRQDGTFSILQHSSADDRGCNGTEPDNIRIMKYLPEDLIRRIEGCQRLLCQRLSSVQRYFAFWKYLVKLDFIQSNSDPDDVVQRLKSPNRCPALEDHELRHYLKSHINMLKEYEERKRDPAFSISKYESFASEKINSELSSGLQKNLDRHDWMLMGQYYDRMKLRGLARKCATQAQMTGVILVGEALPTREHLKEHVLSANPEVKKLSLIKQSVEQSLQVYRTRLQEKFRSRTPLSLSRPLQLLLLGTLGFFAWKPSTN